MRASEQDRHYLEAEGDAFFERNHADADPTKLRPTKQRIAEAIAEAGVRPARVLEFGCGYGDLLHHYAERGAECVGVEPSARAVGFGRQAYGDSIRLLEGTLADNELSAERDGSFDLIVIEDVWCWVSRETLFQSIANVDDLLAEGGFLFIREFWPLRDSRNPNHHVQGAEVWCYKPGSTHTRIFTASGMYAVIWQKVSLDHQDSWVRDGRRDAFESRWSDALLRKSLSDYYR